MKALGPFFCLALVGYCHAAGGQFCYDPALPCGPSNWTGPCGTGHRQSPINLPAMDYSNTAINLDLQAYQGGSFRLQNNGYSIAFDFGGIGQSSKIFTFEDPLNYEFRRQYKFAAGHFHWGVDDYSQGSEHCINDNCGAMELHLVHYLASYDSLDDALASDDEGALTVLGVIIKVSPHNDRVQNLVDSIELVATADESGAWKTIYKPVDFTPWLLEAFQQAYVYKGSLTTPECNEKVNWIVGKEMATTSHQELETMRSIPLDKEGKQLNRNYRPFQQLNGRKVMLANVIAPAKSDLDDGKIASKGYSVFSE